MPLDTDLGTLNDGPVPCAQFTSSFPRPGTLEVLLTLLWVALIPVSCAPLPLRVSSSFASGRMPLGIPFPLAWGGQHPSSLSGTTLQDQVKGQFQLELHVV